MRHRVFVALNFDKEVIVQLEKLADWCRGEIGDMPGIRFLKSNNWHITLSFLGHQDDDAIAKISSAIEKVAAGFPECRVELDRLLYGPPGKTPRMIWAMATPKTSHDLAEIKNTLEDYLEESGVNFKRESRKFNAHITLARFDEGLRVAHLPRLEKSINLKATIPGLDLMESELKRGGAEYAVMQKFTLRG